MTSETIDSPITGGSETTPRRRHRRKASEDDDGTFHEVIVEVRRDDEVMPMPQSSRRKMELMSTIGESTTDNEPNATDADEAVEKTGAETNKQNYTHYTIRTRHNQTKNKWHQRLASCCNEYVDLDDDDVDNLFYCCHPAKLLPQYLFWTFHTSFFMLLISSLFFFMLLILIFAGLMYLVGFFQPQCFQPNFGQNSLGVNDAFTLSWTTFSTVGYGNIYPSLAYQMEQDENIHLCAAISFLCSLESFVGVLYAGFCGAILFGKVLRIQSSARVKFSDPIVVKYGSGVPDEDNDVQEQGSSPNEGLPIPCPVLEFRVINTLSDISGGEILDAQLSAVAILNVDDLNKKNAAKMRMSKNSKVIQLLLTGKKKEPANKKGLPLTNSDATPDLKIGCDRKKIKFHGHAHVEDSASGLVSKRVFSKLTIEPPDHPFFRRVWVARHILNETSPLLPGYIKRLIKANKGYWPAELNTFTAVRDSIKFSQIAVSLSGVSNVSNSSVYAHKLYDFVDVNIGYQFASVLYKDERDIIKVDANLVNDVLEQDGGGGEPL